MICKNSKYLLAILSLYGLTMAPASSQSKLPHIQAIGKITLKNGETTEGVIALGYSYDNKHFHPNAFYYETATDKHLILLDLDFSGFYAELLEAKGATQLFFAESKSDQSQSRYKMTDESGDKVLNKKILREENFILRKEFSINPELPLSLNVRARVADNSQAKSYKVEEIARFELIRNLPDPWVKKIEQAKARLTKKMEADQKRSNLWLEYQEPIWYHDIIHDHIELSKWRHYFN